MKRIRTLVLVVGFVLSSHSALAAQNVIEKQLQEIGSVPNEEVVVVQKKYTRKQIRHELTPIAFGGLPFGTIRRTLMGGASYTLHINDWFAVELFNFSYTKNFFSGFTDNINDNAERPNQAQIKPDYQKLLYFLTGGFQVSPFYGKFSTFSRWIAYIEPFVSLNLGLAKTEVNQYFAVVPGIGLRVFFKEWFSLKVEFKDYLYNEKFVTRTNPPVEQTALRNNYAVMASLSFWLPKMP